MTDRRGACRIPLVWDAGCLQASRPRQLRTAPPGAVRSCRAEPVAATEPGIASPGPGRSGFRWDHAGTQDSLALHAATEAEAPSRTDDTEPHDGRGTVPSAPAPEKAGYQPRRDPCPARPRRSQGITRCHRMLQSAMATSRVRQVRLFWYGSRRPPRRCRTFVRPAVTLGVARWRWLGRQGYT